MVEEQTTKPVTLSEVKNILTKLNKERKELNYEQKIALEHAQKFAKIPVGKTKDMIKELTGLEFLTEYHAYKIADLLPTTVDDVKTIFAKERVSMGENEIKKILEIVNRYYTE